MSMLSKNARLRFNLNGQQVDAPIEWQDISIQADFEVIGDDGELARCYLYKNGSELKVAQFKVEGAGGNIRYIAASVSLTATLSASDTIELYTLLNDFSGNDARVLSTHTSIGGYKLII